MKNKLSKEEYLRIKALKISAKNQPPVHYHGEGLGMAKKCKLEYRINSGEPWLSNLFLTAALKSRNRRMIK